MRTDNPIKNLLRALSIVACLCALVAAAIAQDAFVAEPLGKAVSKKLVITRLYGEPAADGSTSLTATLGTRLVTADGEIGTAPGGTSVSIRLEASGKTTIVLADGTKITDGQILEALGILIAQAKGDQDVAVAEAQAARAAEVQAAAAKLEAIKPAPAPVQAVPPGS